MPIAATIQIVAAVVAPCTPPVPRIRTPAPRKPIPATICAATLPESPVLLVNAYPTIVNAQEPSATSAIVRKPAGFSLRSLSLPTQAPQRTANTASAIEAQGLGKRTCQLSFNQLMNRRSRGSSLLGDCPFVEVMRRRKPRSALEFSSG